MSDNLTDRQKLILAAIVEQYAEVASPVGSVTLAKLFKVSSATIRNEMVALERAGYIKQPHTSAGRVPTDKGYRLYVNTLEQGKGLEVDRRARLQKTPALPLIRALYNHPVIARGIDSPRSHH